MCECCVYVHTSHSPSRFPQCLCGSERYDVRFTRVFTGFLRCAEMHSPTAEARRAATHLKQVDALHRLASLIPTQRSSDAEYRSLIRGIGCHSRNSLGIKSELFDLHKRASSATKDFTSKWNWVDPNRGSLPTCVLLAPKASQYKRVTAQTNTSTSRRTWSLELVAGSLVRCW